MNEKELFYSVYLRKIEDTENDLELITCLNPCFKVLSEDKIKQIEDIVLKSVEGIKTIISSK